MHVSWSAVPLKPTSTIAYKSHLTLLCIAIAPEILLLPSETTAGEATQRRDSRHATLLIVIVKNPSLLKPSKNRRGPSLIAATV